VTAGAGRLISRAAVLAVVLALASDAALADISAGQRALRRGDLQAAYEGFKEAAEEGDAEAAKRLGFMLGRGMEIQGGQKLEARPEEAAKWHRIAADRGDATSADVLGAMLAVGRGVPRDSEEALRRFAQAGRNVDSFKKTAERYPEADRVEITAWLIALRVVRDREIKRLRWVGESGRVSLELHAEPPRVEVVESTSPKLSDYVIDYGKDILDLAPPPPAARREKVVVALEFVYNLEGRRRESSAE